MKIGAGDVRWITVPIKMGFGLWVVYAARDMHDPQ